jgi:outer membrane murein-binding lipoprotein Lpp
MKKLICVIVVCSLFTCASCKTVGKTTTPTTTISTQQLQSEINNLSIQVNAFNTAVSQLQSQINTTTTPTATTTTENPQVAASISSLTDTVKNLSNTISTMQQQISSNESGLLQQVEALQNSLQAAATNIGVLPVTLNGLSVSYITNNITLGITGATLPGTAQFAVKITNTTANTIANLDVTGNITSSIPFSQSLAATYPQVVDATGLCTYNIYIGGTSTVYFEAYGGKTGISIPAGGTVTLRPKISLLALTGSQIPATTLSISLTAITFDITK